LRSTRDGERPHTYHHDASHVRLLSVFVYLLDHFFTALLALVLIKILIISMDKEILIPYTPYMNGTLVDLRFTIACIQPRIIHLPSPAPSFLLL